MKIAFFTHSLNVGGAETIVTEYLLELSRRHEVLLIELEYTDSFLYDKLKAAGIKIYDVLPNIRGFLGRIIRWLIFKFFYRWRINSILKKEKVDILHIHTSASMCANLAIDIKRTFYSFHTGVERNLSFLDQKHRDNMRALSARGMHLVVLSQEMKADAERLLPGADISVVPNGIDLDAVRGARCDRAALLASLDIPETAFILGHVGRFHPVKNHEKLIEIFAQVLKRRSDAYLLLVGAANGDELKRVQDKIAALEVGEHVRILGLRPDAAAITGVFDAFALPSFKEGLPLTLVEAQAHGVRCVASDAVPDEVICNNNCFTLSVDDSAEKWAELLLADTVRTESRDLNTLSVHTAVEKLERLYAAALQ